jgi:hypothetical protein
VQVIGPPAGGVDQLDPGDAVALDRLAVGVAGDPLLAGGHGQQAAPDPAGLAPGAVHGLGLGRRQEPLPQPGQR